tara:strand:- start:21 stop:248 length:228 start_codon:yes stop_codon:yes gene_type:complete
MRVVLHIGEGSSEYYVPEKMYARFQKELMEYHEEKKNREKWICVECGESTYEVDYDYLSAPNLHLQCFLEKNSDG